MAPINNTMEAVYFANNSTMNFINKFIPFIVASNKDGENKDEYSCKEPGLYILIIGLVQVLFFSQNQMTFFTIKFVYGPILFVRNLNPHLVRQILRFLITKKFIIVRLIHLGHILILLILLSVPLAMEHCGWNVVSNYFLGLLGGSLAVTAAIMIHVQPCNARASSYVLARKSARIVAMIFFSCAAHSAGAVAGLYTMRYLNVNPMEKLSIWFCAIVFIGVAVIWIVFKYLLKKLKLFLQEFN